jgi:hypothetical protein
MEQNRSHRVTINKFHFLSTIDFLSVESSNRMFNMKELTANPVECSICKFVVNYIDTVIKDNKTEAAIEAALDKVCTILPHSLNATCIQMVKTYGPVLVEFIEIYGSSDKVCSALKMCNNGTTEEVTSRKLIFNAPF